MRLLWMRHHAPSMHQGMSLMSWNLPPGVTQKMIDDAFSGPEPLECPDCGTMNDFDEDECRNCGFRFVELDVDRLRDDCND